MTAKSFTITDACRGCTLCAKICPVHAINGTLKQKHVIDPERCIRCGACGRVCGNGAVLDAEGRPAERISRNEWKKPAIDSDACVGCSACLVSCPKHCLTLSEPRYQGDTRITAVLTKPEDCIACGECEKVCPVGAVRLAGKGENTVSGNIPKKGDVSAFYRMYCRTFQFGLKIANYFVGYRIPEYIEGSGSIVRLPELMAGKDIRKALVVTGAHIMKRGLPDKMFEALSKAGIEYAVFSDHALNPTSDDVEAGYKAYKDNNCQCIIAFGGGAPMDCAKAIAARVVHPGKTVAQMQGLLKVHKKIPLFFAVPTTSGTGSETTMAAVITDSRTHHKASINDPCILPKYAVLDPELTAGLPPRITAITGMDALSHAVEAYTNRTYNTRLEDKLARDAVRLIHDNLLKAYTNGQDMEARQNMQRAAFFAGRSFTRGFVGYVHAIGHTLGGLYGVEHGTAMAVVLPYVMRQFGPAVHKRLAELADVCGMKGLTDAEKAEKFIQWIEQMKRDMQIPAGLDMIKDKDVDQIISWAMKEANPLYPVPVIWGRGDFEKLLQKMRTA